MSMDTENSEYHLQNQHSYKSSFNENHIIFTKLCSGPTRFLEFFRTLKFPLLHMVQVERLDKTNPGLIDTEVGIPHAPLPMSN